VGVVDVEVVDVVEVVEVVDVVEVVVGVQLSIDLIQVPELA
jgi:hypothetical protein